MADATSSVTSYRLLVHSATQIVQVVRNGERVVRGAEQMNKLAILDRTPEEGLSLVVGMEGKIAAIGLDSVVRKELAHAQYDHVIDATDRCIVPGLVDAHTHAVWVGDRVHEFAMKLAGASYLEVHAAGGGIHFTVGHVARASEDALYAAFRRRARSMLAAGTTLFECKSGYGLSLDAELKMLRVLTRAQRDEDFPATISATYCAAHAVPKGMTAEEATDDIVHRQLPTVKALMDSGELSVQNVDVFCETGVFDVAQTRRILEAGQGAGLAANFHGEELSCLHSAEMGAEISAAAISHLEEVSEEGVRALAAAGTVGVLLPTTAHILRLRSPPARALIEGGVAVALGSDFNPGAHCLAMPLVMHLACVTLRLSMAEALVAATLNAAASLHLAHSHGSLEVGKLGNMVLLEAPRWEHLIYQLGGHNDVISHVIVGGRVMHQRTAEVD